MSLNAFLQERLEARAKSGHCRHLTIVQDLVDLSSNDFLGFSRCHRAVDTPLYGSTGSRLLTGNSRHAEELEQKIAAFHKAEAGLIFNSGYTANLGLISTVAKPSDTVVFDIHCHASMQDGIRLSKAWALPFRHQDLDHLENRLRQSKGNLFICVESIYSCDGSKAPLNEIVSLCKRYGAQLIVDEAHATGLFGLDGQGLCAQLEHPPFARLYTFSKALGAFGAIVVGSSLLRKYLINFCRPFIYTTALPYPNLHAIENGYRRLLTADPEREIIRELVAYFTEKVRLSGLPFLPSETQIHCLLLPGVRNVQEISHFLGTQGLDVRPLTSPTVARGQERLRVCLHAYNKKDEIDLLFTALEKGMPHA
jgi:8-amino-7-oxononanoate synthase